jgi:hypothetical protein
VDADVLKICGVDLCQGETWQSQEEIKEDVEWCLKSIPNRGMQSVSEANSKGSILESALSWSLI